MRNILVIYVARLGDTLLTTPILRHLKHLYPTAQLTFLGHKRSLDLLENLPYLDKLGNISKRYAPYLGWFSSKRYDLALVYGQDQALVRYGERVAKKVICFEQKNFEPRHHTVMIPRPQETIHAVEERIMLLQPLATKLSQKHLSYQVTKAEQAWAQNYCQERQWHRQFLVVMKPNSFADKGYRDWPNKNVLEFCHLLQKCQPQSHFLFLGSQDDQALINPLVEGLSGNATSLAGQLSLRQTGALMAQAHLYVGVDTGLTHLAGALAIPMVALYHCRHRGKYLAPLEHTTCQVIDHPCPDHVCSPSTSMVDISAKQVFKATQLVISRQENLSQMTLNKC